MRWRAGHEQGSENLSGRPSNRRAADREPAFDGDDLRRWCPDDLLFSLIDAAHDAAKALNTALDAVSLPEGGDA